MAAFGGYGGIIFKSGLQVWRQGLPARPMPFFEMPYRLFEGAVFLELGYLAAKSFYEEFTICSVGDVLGSWLPCRQRSGERARNR